MSKAKSTDTQAALEGGTTATSMSTAAQPGSPAAAAMGATAPPDAPGAPVASGRGRKKGSVQKKPMGIVAEKAAELRDARIMAKVLAAYTKMTPWGRGYFMTEVKNLEVQPDIAGLRIPAKPAPGNGGSTAGNAQT